MLASLACCRTNPIPALAPAAWFQANVGVTGTLAASNWADQSGNGRDLAQSTEGNRPVHLAYSGTPYAWLPGVSGNYFSTPDSAAASVTGPITIDVYAAADDWTPSAYTSFVGKWEPVVTANESYALGINTNGTLLFSARNSGEDLTQVSSTAAPTVSNGGALWVRASVTVGGSKQATFYTSSDGSIWTQLGNAVSAPSTTNILNSTYELAIGGTSAAADNFSGRIYRVKIYNSALGSGSGTPVVDFNPSDFAETSTNGATAVSSTTGETWTLNSTGAKPAQIVKSASLLGDGTNHKMATANFTLDQPFTRFIVARQISWTAGDYLCSGTAGAAGITQVTGTPKIGLSAGAVVADNTGAVLGSKVIIAAVFNGASSSLQVNAATATTGDPGAGNPGGLSILSDNAGANYGNWQVYEDLTLTGAAAAATRALVRNWLNWVHHVY